MLTHVTLSLTLSLIYFTHYVPKLRTVKYILIPPSKQKLIKLLSTIRSLLCGNLVYKVGQSKVEKEISFLCLYSLFITWLLACRSVPSKSVKVCKNLHLSLHVCIYVKKENEKFMLYFWLKIL